MCLWYGNDKNTWAREGQLHRCTHFVSSSCLWILDISHPITLLFADRLKLDSLPKKYCNTMFLLLAVYCIII